MRAVNRKKSHQVGNLLAQLDTFSRVCVTTTNHVQHIDPAAPRRFEVKLHFAPLRPEQAWEAFERLCDGFCVRVNPALRDALTRMEGLTPGDLAAVKKRARLPGIASAAALLDALSEECTHKLLARHTIGFVPPACSPRLAPAMHDDALAAA